MSDHFVISAVKNQRNDRLVQKNLYNFVLENLRAQNRVLDLITQIVKQELSPQTFKKS